MLTKGDEYPLHQTPDPIAFSGTDRNFYDRYFFNGMRKDGSGFFAVAFGVYPHLNIADAHFSALRNGEQISVHASRVLDMERLDLNVGPIKIEIIEPLQKLRVIVDGEGVKADLVCEGRSFPLQEPRFTRRNGPRLAMDVTRFTQGVRWTGFIEIDGKRETYAGDYGVRDRSWGIRQIGAPDPQPTPPMQPPQFYWLWAPTHFENMALYAHINDDAEGVAWNQRAALAADGAKAEGITHFEVPKFKMDWTKGKRHAKGMALECTDDKGRPMKVTWTPIETFQMKGIGYMHPQWGHGGFKGLQLTVERESFKPSELNPLEPFNLHIQEVSRATLEWEGKKFEGVGAFEQLVIGPHGPSGFKGMLDGAA